MYHVCKIFEMHAKLDSANKLFFNFLNIHILHVGVLQQQQYSKVLNPHTLLQDTIKSTV